MTDTLTSAMPVSVMLSSSAAAIVMASVRVSGSSGSVSITVVTVLTPVSGLDSSITLPSGNVLLAAPFWLSLKRVPLAVK